MSIPTVEADRMCLQLVQERCRKRDLIKPVWNGICFSYPELYLDVVQNEEAVKAEILSSLVGCLFNAYKFIFSKFREDVQTEIHRFFVLEQGEAKSPPIKIFLLNEEKNLSEKNLRIIFCSVEKHIVRLMKDCPG